MKLNIMKLTLTTIGILLCITSSFSQIGIGIPTPDASSVLHLESTQAGLLLPRLTTDQRNAIVSPAKSLIIYNTDINAIEINLGTSGSPSWSLIVDDAAPVYTPSVTTAQMNALPSTAGSIVYNTTVNCVFQYKGAPFNRWQSLCEKESSKILTLYIRY